MEEKIKDVLDAYTFQTTRVCRGRGAFICDTDQGMKIVKAYHRSPQRLEFEQSATEGIITWISCCRIKRGSI